MRILPSPSVLGIVSVCALCAGCVFDSKGLPPYNTTAPDASDGSVADKQHLEVSADAPRDQLLHDQPLHDQPLTDWPIPDRPLLDQPVQDTKSPPDAPPVKPDTGGCLVENFASGLGKVQPKSGQWALSGGALRQSKTGGGNYAVITGVAASDYVVSALVTVHSKFPKTGWTVGAALGVRLQPGTALTPRQYLCGVYPGTAGLVIVYCSGGDPNNTCTVVRKTGPQINLGQQVLVRATMVGTTLTCELPQLSGSTTYSTGGLTSGGPTLITQYVDASYDNLSVCPHAP
jgi:hypothetical protein